MVQRMSIIRISVLGAGLAALLAASCGSPSSEPARTGGDDARSEACTEGRAVGCRCSDGARGAQTCQPDGTWGPCDCDQSPPEGDTGVEPTDTSEETSEQPDPDTGETPGDDSGQTADASEEDTSGSEDTQSPEDFQTITVAAGERKTFDIGPGESLENVLVDITADDADVFFDVTGGTLRDVGVKGELPADGTLAHVTAPDPDGEALVENVYAGDGTDADVGDATAFWVDATDEDAHRGVATFRNVHTADFNDNAIYGSGPGYQLGPDEGGEVHIESCYSYNNNISNFRIGTNGSYVKNSVAVVPPDTNAPRHPNGRNARGVRAIEGATEMLVEDSEIFTPDWEAVEVDGAATVRNTSYRGDITGNATTENLDNNVDKSPPPGVPMTAKEAAQGL